MMESIWPKIQPPSIKKAALIGRFILNFEHFKSFIVILIGTGIYLGGVFLKIPALSGADYVTVDDWWFLSFLDQFFTGGALGRGSAFGLGIFAVLALGGFPIRREKSDKTSLQLRACFFLCLVTLLTSWFASRAPHPIIWWRVIEIWIALAIGGGILYYISEVLRKHKAPRILSLNVMLLITHHYRHLLAEQPELFRTIDGWLVIIGAFVFVISGYHFLKSGAFLEVENIRTPEDRRKALILFKGADKETLSLIGILGIGIFVPLSGLGSLILNWRSFTGENFFEATALSLLVLLTIVIFLPVLIAPISKIFPFQNPKWLTSQLLKHFWIVPNIQAGRKTEEFLRQKMKQRASVPYFLIAGWVTVFTCIQWYSLSFGTSVFLYPYGPFLFCCLSIFVVEDFSKTVEILRSKFDRLKYVFRGTLRIDSDSLALPTPNDLISRDVDELELDAVSADIEPQALLEEFAKASQATSLSEVLRNGEQVSKKVKLAIYLIPFVVSIGAGIILAFFSALLTILFHPTYDQDGTLESITITSFVVGVFSPTFLSAWIKKWLKRHWSNAKPTQKVKQRN